MEDPIWLPLFNNKIPVEGELIMSLQEWFFDVRVFPMILYRFLFHI